MLSASAWLNRSHARRLHGADHCRSHPDDPRLVWLFQACLSRDVSRAGWIHPPTTSGDPAPTGQTTGFWTMSRRSETLAQCLLRWTGSFHDDRSPNVSEPIPMRKPLTGEPCAGEPHARFGGRGGRQPFPTPIRFLSLIKMLKTCLDKRTGFRVKPGMTGVLVSRGYPDDFKKSCARTGCDGLTLIEPGLKFRWPVLR